MATPRDLLRMVRERAYSDGVVPVMQLFQGAVEGAASRFFRPRGGSDGALLRARAIDRICQRILSEEFLEELTDITRNEIKGSLPRLTLEEVRRQYNADQSNGGAVEVEWIGPSGWTEWEDVLKMASSQTLGNYTIGDALMTLRQCKLSDQVPVQHETKRRVSLEVQDGRIKVDQICTEVFKVAHHCIQVSLEVAIALDCRCRLLEIVNVRVASIEQVV